MKKKQAKKLLYRVLQGMVSQASPNARQDLQCVGEALLGEWKDCKVKATKDRIRALTDYQPVPVHEPKPV